MAYRIEMVYRILYAIAQINGDEDQLQLNPLEDDFFAGRDDLKAAAVPEKAHDSQRAKSKRMTFEEIGISVGAVLHFKEDPSVTVAIVERCYGRVAASLGISDQVERARRRLATEISSGSISATGMPKRNLGLS